VVFRRLRNAPNVPTAECILKLLTVYKAAPAPPWSDRIAGDEDPTSVAILRMFSPSVLQRYTPRATFGDGNCCFRAVSLSRFDTEEHHGYVRLITGCEMIIHAADYDISSPTCLLKDDRICTPAVDKATSTVLKNGTSVDLLHMYAISSALDITIQSYTPPAGAIGLGTSPYTVLVAGRQVRRTKAPSMTLMWTAMQVPSTGASFKPNHIVLLAERPAVSEPAIDVNDSTATFDYNVGAAAEPCNDVTVADHSANQSSAYERSFSDADVDSGDEQDAPVTPGEQQDGDISSEPEFLDETGRLTTHVAITK